MRLANTRVRDWRMFCIFIALSDKLGVIAADQNAQTTTMTQKLIIILFTLTFMVTITSCGNTVDKALCGEPEGKQKEFIDKANLQYKDQFVVRHVSCYTDYMRVDIKANYTKTIIDSLENAYCKQINFVEFLVYDKDGKLIRGNTGSM